MKPLEGMLVIAMEQAVAAPFCTSRLMQAGARVIKIERPVGDFARSYDTAAKGDSSYFAWINQNKESITLNFKDSDDAELLHAMLSKADVFIQNLAPGAMSRAGFGSDDLRKKYPRLITCDITGYGDSEEVKGLKAYDLLVQAESGLVSISGGPGELGRVGVSISDIGAGMTAHAALMEALMLRERSGEAKGVKVSLFDTTAEWMTVPLIHAEYGKGAPGRVGLKHPSIAPYDAYETKDGVKTVVSIQNEREWVRFCETVLKVPDVAVDERFSSNNVRVANREELDEIIMSVIGDLSAEEYRHRLETPDLAYGRVNTVDNLSDHVALTRIQVRSSTGDQFTIPAPPIKWSDAGGPQTGWLPEIGEHTSSIRAEFLPDKEGKSSD